MSTIDRTPETFALLRVVAYGVCERYLLLCDCPMCHTTHAAIVGVESVGSVLADAEWLTCPSGAAIRLVAPSAARRLLEPFDVEIPAYQPELHGRAGQRAHRLMK